MKQKTVIITGGNGDIGQALCLKFKHSGWRVISTDQQEHPKISVDSYIPIEFERFCDDSDYNSRTTTLIKEQLTGTNLHTLINNAAVQIVAPAEELTLSDWKATLNVNLLAPFLLIQFLLPVLAKTKGCIINISSIHTHLTKPNFTAYASSKAALLGMTKSLAVELGSTVRVNGISPAAISTSMLKDGFDGKLQNLNKLASFHPSGCIGTTKDVADAALYLANATGNFLNGTIIDLDGGISSRLHDPF